uniref:Uncharacterized protein n=1 Tax=Utricularia reniformis TaxID=192314 RepID=A0A1Y0AZW5_9LAMI|nr:hypothetical protein AEK19_MT0466 [Utricularia reniformis]ART30726.1 hypothetical protein AEK19_MT0466 [Utricularia reniformis]
MELPKLLPLFWNCKRVGWQSLFRSWLVIPFPLQPSLPKDGV